MKNIILILSFTLSSLSFSNTIKKDLIQKEITIISDCEIVSILGNSIELKTVIDLNVHPKTGDSATAIINTIYTDKNGYRAFNKKSFSLVFLESLKSGNTLTKYFTITGDIDYIKKVFKVGESIALSWKTTTQVEHYIEKDDINTIVLENFNVDGLSVGLETYIDENEYLIVANHSLGLKHGIEIIYNKGVKAKETYWCMGKKYGYVTFWYPNGQIKSKIFYIDDTAESYAESFYENGQHKQVTYFYGGKKHGKDTFYFENGNIQDDAHYKNGGFDGICTKYYENGVIHFQDNRIEGVIEGEYFRNYKSGQLEVKTNFVNNKVEGDYIDYYENGKKKSKGKYHNGDKIGKWTYWDENGKKTIKNVD